MASKKVLLAILAIVAVSLPAVARATNYLVGDSNGWGLGFNYTLWAAGKDFQVGDTLVFKYKAGIHNVYKVNGADFQACRVPSANESAPLTSGDDVINLATPGRKWYMCGAANGDHCRLGQKLVITVQPLWMAPAPSPSAVPAPSPVYSRFGKHLFKR